MPMFRFNSHFAADTDKVFLGMRSCVLIFASFFGSIGIGHANASQYQVTDLNATLGAFLRSDSTFITNGGTIVGNGAAGLTRWDGNVATVLGTLSHPTAINSAGEILARDNSGRLAVWTGINPKVLVEPAAPPGYSNNFGGGLNRSGAVLGTVYVQDFNDCCFPHAAILDGTNVTDLGGDYYGIRPVGINDAGIVVGDRGANLGGAGGRSDQAWVWDGNARTDLTNLSTQGGYFGKGWSVVAGINSGGQIVGTSAVINDRPGTCFPDGWGCVERAVIWNGLTPTNLGTLEGGGASGGLGINASGQVVGWSNLDYSPLSFGSFHATFWNGTEAIDLNSFLSRSVSDAGWILTHAYAINDGGSILAQGSNLGSGKSHQFLLTPIPEPETYLLMSLGLFAVTVISRRMTHAKSAAWVSA